MRRRRRPADRTRTPEQTTGARKRVPEKADRVRRSGSEPRPPASLQHEISVHQEELISQNEALMSAQSALDATRDRFIELYDSAPNGYLTLDANGVVRECNLTAAVMLGRSKPGVEGLTLLGLVHPDERSSLIRFLRRCRSGQEAQIESEFLIRTANGPRHVQLLCRRRADDPTEFFASMVDVTERRQLQVERLQLAEERAALASRLLSAEEHERRRIARNLHDDLGQQVTALRFTVEHLLTDTHADVRGRLLNLREAVAHLDESLHLVSLGLRPPALEFGLVPAVRQLLNEWSASTGVAASLQADDLPEGWLAPDIDLQLFRIAQEALANVAKHAGAGSVAVGLARLNAGASLTIADDGRGFDVEAARGERARFGLMSMRERAQLIGGTLEIRRRSVRGTVVSCTVPRGLSRA